VAWTACDGASGERCRRGTNEFPVQVFSYDSRKKKILASARDVDPESLRFEADRRHVSWLVAGERRIATLR